MKRPYYIKLSRRVSPGTYTIFKNGPKHRDLVEHRFPTVNDAMNYLMGRELIPRPAPCGLGNTALGTH